MGKILHKNEEVWTDPKKYTMFGDKLKKRRKQFDLYRTQDAFADAMGVSVETVRNWEQGRIIPPTGTIVKIADLLDCDTDYLLGRVDCKKRDDQFIQDQTGLSEDAIRKLRSWHNAKDQSRLWSKFISDLITDDDVALLLSHVSYLHGDYKYLDELNKLDADASDLIEAETDIASEMYYISRIFSNIIEHIGQ